MIDIDKKLTTVLKTTGFNVYPIVKPLTAAVPCIVYRRVSTHNEISHSGKEDSNRDRFQVIAVHTTYSGMLNLQNSIETLLIANTSDWDVSLPTDIKFDDYDDENKFFSCNRDFLIRYN